MTKKKDVIDEMFSGEKQEQTDVVKATSISMEMQKTLAHIAKVSGLKKSEVEKMFTESYNELESKGVKTNLEKLALNGVKNKIRRQTRRIEWTPKAKATLFKGFIIGDSGMFDKAELLRNEAKRFVEKYGVEAAIEQQYITADNQVIDRRVKVYGRTNLDYLKPLPTTTKLRTRTIHMIAMKIPNIGEPLEKYEVYKYGTIQTNDNALSLGWGQVKLFVPCQIYGIIKEETETDFKLNSSQAQDTVSIFKAIRNEDWALDKIFMDVVTPKLTKIEKVEQTHEYTKDAWDRIVFVRGIVTWINRDKPSPWGSIWMGLMSDGEDVSEVRVRVPAHLDIDFGEESEIIVIGKTNRTKAKDPDTGKLVNADVVIDAVGLYPIRGLTTPAEVGKKAPAEDEVEIEGWLDN